MDSIINNPMACQARAAMDPEDLEAYRKEGEYIFGNLGDDGSFDPEKSMLVRELGEKLRAKMHPAFVTDEERALMVQYVGKDWYAQFGFTEADLGEDKRAFYETS